MDWFQVVFLAVLQGLTEFLPVSSSGHLVVFQKLFGISEPPILFDVLLHVGTLGAIIVYFRQGLGGVIKGNQGERRVLWLVLLGTIPAGVVGGLFEKQIALAFNSLPAVGISFLITAGLLFSIQGLSRVIKGNKGLSAGKAGLSGVGIKEALLVGILQAVAILPGVSRSGSTIVAGLWGGLSHQTAFVFSFYLAIPAILGALVLKSQDLISASSNNLLEGLVGMVVAGLIGYFALRILENVLKSAKFWWFGIYCAILGMVLLLLSL